MPTSDARGAIDPRGGYTVIHLPHLAERYEQVKAEVAEIFALTHSDEVRVRLDALHKRHYTGNLVDVLIAGQYSLAITELHVPRDDDAGRMRRSEMARSIEAMAEQTLTYYTHLQINGP